jgi:acylphosphatase
VKRVSVVVSGRVQGIGFRYSCEDVAHNNGISGWVRNLPDGRVEAEFEGQDADVEAMVSWCRQGPPMAWIESVEVSTLATTGEAGFRVR